MKSQTIKPVPLDNPFLADIKNHATGKMEMYEIFECYLDNKGGVAIYCGRKPDGKHYRYGNFLPIEVGQQQ